MDGITSRRGDPSSKQDARVDAHLISFGALYLCFFYFLYADLNISYPFFVAGRWPLLYIYFLSIDAFGLLLVYTWYIAFGASICMSWKFGDIAVEHIGGFVTIYLSGAHCNEAELYTDMVGLQLILLVCSSSSTL